MYRNRFRRLEREASALKGSWASLSMVKPVEIQNVPPTSNRYQELWKSKSSLDFNDQPC